jgi:hypothetical protein
MSWEPCICKHGPKYDDPWTYNCESYKPRPGVAKRKSRAVLVYDMATLQTSDFESQAEAARQINVHHRARVSLSAKTVIVLLSRYICAYTIQGLFDNMKANGLT